MSRPTIFKTTACISFLIFVLLIAYINFIERSAEKNYPEAQSELGRWYDLGLWFHKQDKTRAKELYLKAANQGLAQAQYNLGVLFEEEHAYDQAAHWYLLSALQMYPPAQLNLGALYSEGLGLAVNKTEAAKWYEKAASNGHRIAQFNLGKSYYSGEGVIANSQIAAEWMRKSAEQDYGPAQGYLALLYASGEGVPLDLEIARAWALKAIANGDESSETILESIEGNNIN